MKSVSGKNVADLTDAEAEHVAADYAARGIGVEALSTNLFELEIESGEAVFARGRVRGGARAARSGPRAGRSPAAADDPADRRRDEPTRRSAQRFRLRSGATPVAAPVVRPGRGADSRRRLSGRGREEIGGSLFARPDEVVDFFEALGRRDEVAFTWDVQNLWQLGTFPSLEVYHRLRPFIGYLHLEGGIAGPDGRTLKWRSTLEAAGWPVLEITRAAVADGVSPVICLNPSHGEFHPDRPMEGAYGRDLEFLRRELSPFVV